MAFFIMKQSRNLEASSAAAFLNGFPKFLSLSKTLKNETQQLKNNGGIFFP